MLQRGLGTSADEFMAITEWRQLFELQASDHFTCDWATPM
jgi:hypothetical protein